MSDNDIIPNTIDARLVRCLVVADDKGPEVSTETSYLPIAAFERSDAGYLVPILISKQFVAWTERRASVTGCYVDGVTFGSRDVVATPDHHFNGIDAFVAFAASEASWKIAEVRREKGWPESTWPKPLLPDPA